MLQDTKTGLEKDLTRAEEINVRLNNQKNSVAGSVLKSHNKDKEVEELKKEVEKVRSELQEANVRNLG